MAISRKGMRRIVVGGKRYLWRFRQDEDCWVAGGVLIVREDSNVSGRRSPTITFVVPLGDKCATPKVVRRAIEYALWLWGTAEVAAENDVVIGAERSAALFEGLDPPQP